MPGLVEIVSNYTYETAGGGNNTVLVFQPLDDLVVKKVPGGEFPKIAGVWRESPTKALTITQTGEKFTALCTYSDDEHGEIRWEMTGTISKNRQLRGRLVHTKAPKTWGSQTRTGVLSSDGTSIKGNAALAEGGSEDFEWKLDAPPARR